MPRSSSSAPNGAHLSVDGISVVYPDRRVLTDITFTARDGDRLGLIGENGTGKSTLLRVLSGKQQPTAGSVTLPDRFTMELLDQQLPYPDSATLADVLDDAQREQIRVLASLERLAMAISEDPQNETIAAQYGEALEQAERLSAWSMRNARAEVLAGLSLSDLPESRTVGELSGGQRVRLALGAVLLRAPRLLLLDEPSNHLDDASAAYLENTLREWRGIVIFASHDRSLLDAVATTILDLDPLPHLRTVLNDSSSVAGVGDDPDSGLGDDPGSGIGVRLWGMGYTASRRARADEMRRWRALYAAELERVAALEHEINVGSREVNRKHESKSEAKITRKFYADKDARVTSRRARNARVRLATLDRERVARPPEPLRFRGFHDEAAEPSADDAETALMVHDARPALVAEQVSRVGRLDETSLSLNSGERLLLQGSNGSGKSTLLALLAGTLSPSTGSVTRYAPLGYLPQEVRFSRPSRSAEEVYDAALGEDLADRVPLEDLGLLARRDLRRPVGALSVGQQRRLALAVLVADAPEVLLLDEPTNHLSLSLVEELEEALRQYRGALVVASHDRFLRSSWEGRVLQVGDQNRC